MSTSKRKKGSVMGLGGPGGTGAAGAAGAAGGDSDVPEVGEVGRLVDCSQADDRRMIRLVRERPLLYARNNMPVASYYSQVKKLWQQVANDMGWSVADVRRKWSHIRNSYSRHLRNEMYGVRTGRGRMVSKWYLADELDFLRDHMATDTRPSRYSYAPLFLDMKTAEAPGAGAGAGVGAGEPRADHVDLKPFISTPWFALSSPPRDAPLQLTVEPQPRPPDCASPHSFEPDENSAYFRFFRGIHNDYQELPAKKQRLFRRECLAFLHRLLDEEEPQEQLDALNLSNPADTDDERECKPIIIDREESDGGGDVDHSNNILPH